jgi:hypothetical protein
MPRLPGVVVETSKLEAPTNKTKRPKVHEQVRGYRLYRLIISDTISTVPACWGDPLGYLYAICLGRRLSSPSLKYHIDENSMFYASTLLLVSTSPEISGISKRIVIESRSQVWSMRMVEVLPQWKQLVKKTCGGCCESHMADVFVLSRLKGT